MSPAFCWPGRSPAGMRVRAFGSNRTGPRHSRRIRSERRRRRKWAGQGPPLNLFPRRKCLARQGVRWPWSCAGCPFCKRIQTPAQELRVRTSSVAHVGCGGWWQGNHRHAGLPWGAGFWNGGGNAAVPPWGTPRVIPGLGSILHAAPGVIFRAPISGARVRVVLPRSSRLVGAYVAVRMPDADTAILLVSSTRV